MKYETELARRALEFPAVKEAFEALAQELIVIAPNYSDESRVWELCDQAIRERAVDELSDAFLSVADSLDAIACECAEVDGAW